MKDIADPGAPQMENVKEVVVWEEQKQIVWGGKNKTIVIPGWIFITIGVSNHGGTTLFLDSNLEEEESKGY